jgi:multidrug efflux system membrane fusion protein
MLRVQNGRSAARVQQAVPVTVACDPKAIPVQVQAIGNVQAYSTVSVRPQVGGEITGVYFQRGQNVKRATPV